MKPNHFAGWLLAIATAMLLASANARGQSVNPCDKPSELPPSFFEVPVGPQGNWKASVSLDVEQDKDPMVPVLVAGVGSIQGPAARRGMRLGCGLLKNRSEKSAVAVQLRWILVRSADRQVILQSGFKPDAVLNQGLTPEIPLNISGNDSRRTDFSIISFAEVTAPFTKDGMLVGDYLLLVGVNQVRFSDGSVWNAAPLPR